MNRTDFNVTFRTIGFVLVLLVYFFGCWLHASNYQLTEEDIGFLIGTREWAPMSWLADGNKHFLEIQSTSTFYWRPLPLFLSHAYLSLVGDDWWMLIWLNVFLQIVLIIVVARLISTIAKPGTLNSITYSGIIVLSTCALTSNSIAQYNWLQFNVSTVLFFVGLHCYVTRRPMTYLLAFTLCLLSKDSAILLFAITTIDCILRKNAGFYRIMVAQTSILIVYFLYRIHIGSISTQYLPQHGLGQFNIIGSVEAWILALPQYTSLKYPELSSIALVINTACVIFFSLLMTKWRKELADANTVSLATMTVVLIVAMVFFGKAHWKVETQIMVSLTLLFLFLSHFKRHITLPLLLAFMGLSGLIKLTDHHLSLQRSAMDFFASDELRLLKQSIEWLNNHEITQYAVVPNRIGASIDMSLSILGISNQKARALVTDAPTSDVFYASYNFKPILDRERQSIQLIDTEKPEWSKAIQIEEKTGLIVIDANGHAAYTAFKSNGSLTTHYENKLGASLLSKDELLTKLPSQTCEHGKFVVVGLENRKFKLNIGQPNSIFSFNKHDCTTRTRVFSSGEASYMILDDEEQILSFWSVDGRSLTH